MITYELTDWAPVPTSDLNLLSQALACANTLKEANFIAERWRGVL